MNLIIRGGPPKNGKPGSGHYPRLKKEVDTPQAAIKDFEDKFYAAPLEHALAVGPQGVVLELSGTADEIPITDEQAELLRDTIFTHNHPLEGSDSEDFHVPGLSEGDMRVAVGRHVKEIRAVDETKIYSLSTGIDKLDLIDRQPFLDYLDTREDLRFSKNNLYTYHKDMTLQEYHHDTVLETAKGLAKMTGGLYREIDRKTRKVLYSYP